MRKTSNKILIIFLMSFFAVILSFGQTIKVDGKEVTIDPDTENKVLMLVDSLNGTWQLIKTIRYESGDTIIQEPSTQLWITPGAKPYTNIKIDSLKNFEIEQTCMKCPYLFWEGQYEIEIRALDGVGFFYLNFIDNRIKVTKNKKPNKAFVMEFSGYLTSFENREMTLTNKEGNDWIYRIRELD